MKLLWLCNLAPGPVQQALGAQRPSGLWMDHVLSGLREKQDISVRILSPGTPGEGRLDDRCSYRIFPKGKNHQVLPELKPLFSRELADFQPDVIHIWGTEFGHTLAMMEACRDLKLLDRTVISIQGLTWGVARHFAEGIPVSVQTGYTFRDLVRHDNLLHQQKMFALRGEHEKQALALAKHVIGRTHWDRACMAQLAPEAEYHFCSETLREPFYRGSWSYEACEKHRIFVSNWLYPVKGFHNLLEAMAPVLKKYPDAAVAVPGASPVAKSLSQKLRQDSYARYLEKLILKNRLEDRVTFLGSLTAQQMKEQYLKANVFVLPSNLENSPNSLGEAMLLGVPSAAADVGGVTTMLQPETQGLVYQGTAPYMLADCIDRIFSMGAQAEAMGRQARAHAMVTHDPAANLTRLLEIYETLGRKECLP